LGPHKVHPLRGFFISERQRTATLVRFLIGVMMTTHAAEKNIPPALAAQAAGRDYFGTKEFARTVNLAPETVRNQHSRKGTCCGIKPIRVGRQLLWPIAEVALLLQQGESE